MGGIVATVTGRLRHPEHGVVHLNKRYEVCAYNSDTEEVEHFPDYELCFVNSSAGCKIYNKTRDKSELVPNRYAYLPLRLNGRIRQRSIFNIMLCSAFPHIRPAEYVLEDVNRHNDNCKKPTIDHRDGVYTNNNITNIRWLTHSHNSRLGAYKALGKRMADRENHKAGKKIFILAKGAPPEHEQRFESVTLAAEFVKEQIHLKKAKTRAKHDTALVNIRVGLRTVCDKSNKYAYGFSVRQVPHDVIAGEEWRTSHISDKYQVSNKARVRNKRFNTILVPVKGRRPQYTRHNLTVNGGKIREYTHTLVYGAFNGNQFPLADGFEILHKDDAPKTADGYYRNWLIDLRVGRHSENMVESWEARRAREA